MKFVQKTLILAIVIGAVWYGHGHGWGFWAYVLAVFAGFVLGQSDEHSTHDAREWEEARRRVRASKDKFDQLINRR